MVHRGAEGAAHVPSQGTFVDAHGAAQFAPRSVYPGQVRRSRQQEPAEGVIQPQAPSGGNRATPVPLQGGSVAVHGVGQLVDLANRISGVERAGETLEDSRWQRTGMA